MPDLIAKEALAALDKEVVFYRPQIEAFLSRNGIGELNPEMQASVRKMNDCELRVFCFIPMMDEKLHKAAALEEDCRRSEHETLARETRQLLEDFKAMKRKLVDVLAKPWDEDVAQFRFLGDTSLYHF
jgi:hypothetical protein